VTDEGSPNPFGSIATFTHFREKCCFSAEFSGWWHLKTIGSTARSTQKNKNSHATKNAVKVLKRGYGGETFSKVSPPKAASQNPRPKTASSRPSPEFSGWWHLKTIGSTERSTQKNKNSHAIKNAVKVLKGFGKTFSKVFPRKNKML